MMSPKVLTWSTSTFHTAFSGSCCWLRRADVGIMNSVYLLQGPDSARAIPPSGCPSLPSTLEKNRTPFIFLETPTCVCVCVFSPAFRGAFVALWGIFPFENAKLGFRVYIEKLRFQASNFLSSMWKPCFFASLTRAATLSGFRHVQAVVPPGSILDSSLRSKLCSGGH